MTTLTRVIHRRLDARGPDRGSIAMLLLVSIIGVVLSAALIPVIVAQSHTTRFDTTRSDALNAAQTGVQVAVGKFRDAVGSDGTPDAGMLPCGPLAGTVAGSGTARYWAQIIYYSVDPITNPSAQKMVCVDNYGPYDTTLHVRTPHYACIISTGVVEGSPTAQTSNTCSTAVASFSTTTVNGASHGRTLVSTYVFNTDDTNYAGGILRIFPSGSDQYCMDAGSATPAASTAILLQPCSSSLPPAPQQTWAYRCDLSIQLVSSVTLSVLTENSSTCTNTCRGTSAECSSAAALGMCIDSDTPHAAGDAVYVKPCSALGAAPSRQQWSVDDNAHLRGSNALGTDIDGYCINIGSQAANAAITLQSCAGGTSDVNQTWVPSPTTGAGMAGATNRQLVNFKLFGNCLDVTGQDVSSTYLIAYTCKQNPDPTKVTWNQKFTASPSLAGDATAKPTTVEWITTYNGSNYCVKSPQTNGGYVVVALCPSSYPSSPSPYLWKVYRLKQSDGVSALTYDQKYTIVDSSNSTLCLSLGLPSDLYLSQYQKIVTATCDGSTGQKWNADASTGRSILQNTHEP